MNNFKSISTSYIEKPKPEELLHLFKQTTWAEKRKLVDIEVLLKQTTVFVTLRKDGVLLGFGRAISDGIYRAIIDDVIVDKAYKNKGLGKQIVNGLLQELNGVEDVFLNTNKTLESYYNQFGFKAANCLTMHKKQNKSKY